MFMSRLHALKLYQSLTLAKTITLTLILSLSLTLTISDPNHNFNAHNWDINMLRANFKWKCCQSPTQVYCWKGCEWAQYYTGLTLKRAWVKYHPTSKINWYQLKLFNTFLILYYAITSSKCRLTFKFSLVSLYLSYYIFPLRAFVLCPHSDHSPISLSLFTALTQQFSDPKSAQGRVCQVNLN